MQTYKTVSGEVVAEITEKRSRFIATLRPVQTEQEACEFVSEIKAKYWDARHDVFAYCLNENNLVRFSDDGEPHGTAGKPVLDVLVGRELKNAAVVVTRYFGGVLLGTGGLVRAYSSACAAAVDSAEICEMRNCVVASITTDYSRYEKLKSMLDNISGAVTDTVFENDITVRFYISFDEYDEFCKKITETFFGKINVEKVTEKFFPVILK